VQTESRQIDRLLFQEPLVARLVGIIRFVGAGVGLRRTYGLLSCEVSRNTRDWNPAGLGARPASVLRLVLRQGIGLAMVGPSQVLAVTGRDALSETNAL
jgi:hypothetical protein